MVLLWGRNSRRLTDQKKKKKEGLVGNSSLPFWTVWDKRNMIVFHDEDFLVHRQSCTNTCIVEDPCPLVFFFEWGVDEGW